MSKLTSLFRIWLTRSFKPFTFIGRADESLPVGNIEELGLYIHIPFCVRLCSFCPYCKVPYRPELAERYGNALLHEIDLVGQNLPTKKKVTSLYFGGGSPALMLDALPAIIQRIERYFDITEGIGIELHPDNVTQHILFRLKQIGITMISVGVQSMNEACLSALGRQPVDHEAMFRTIQEANFSTVDVDLIFAIPEQTPEILLADMEYAFRHGATQISTYPFIDFTFASNKYKPLPERTKKSMLHAVVDYCRATGRKRTSVWTFAAPGTTKYSSVTRDNFLGFGVSAATLLKDIFKINTFDVEGYISRIEENRLPTSLTLNFSLRQRAVYYLFWNAYSMNIDPAHFKLIFGRSLHGLFGLEFTLARLMGFLSRKNGTYRLTEKGAYYYHYLEQAYTTAYIDAMWSLCRSIPFPERLVLK